MRLLDERAPAISSYNILPGFGSIINFAACRRIFSVRDAKQLFSFVEKRPSPIETMKKKCENENPPNRKPCEHQSAAELSTGQKISPQTQKHTTVKKKKKPKNPAKLRHVYIHSDPPPTADPSIFYNRSVFYQQRIRFFKQLLFAKSDTTSQRRQQEWRKSQLYKSTMGAPTHSGSTLPGSTRWSSSV